MSVDESPLLPEKARTVTLFVSTSEWNLGEPAPGTNCRPMTYLGGTFERVEVPVTRPEKRGSDD